MEKAPAEDVAYLPRPPEFIGYGVEKLIATVPVVLIGAAAVLSVGSRRPACSPFHSDYVIPPDSIKMLPGRTGAMLVKTAQLDALQEPSRRRLRRRKRTGASGLKTGGRWHAEDWPSTPLTLHHPSMLSPSPSTTFRAHPSRYRRHRCRRRLDQTTLA